MILVFLFGAACLLSFWLYQRGKRLRSRELKEVMSKEVKRMVNLPVEDDTFPDVMTGIQGKKASRKLLKLVNEQEDREN